LFTTREGERERETGRKGGGDDGGRERETGREGERGREEQLHSARAASLSPLSLSF